MDRFDMRYTSDLADTLGNLANRTISMIERYRDALIPEGEPASLDAAVSATVERYRAAMDADLLHLGAQAAMDLAVAANGFVEERAPWSQAKDPARAGELDSTLASLARACATLTTLLAPFLPNTMQTLAERLGLAAPPTFADLPSLSFAGRTVHRGSILFPKPKPE
jgi:methionyl-tRNA synthetase